MSSLQSIPAATRDSETVKNSDASETVPKLGLYLGLTGNDATHSLRTFSSLACWLTNGLLKTICGMLLGVAIFGQPLRADDASGANSANAATTATRIADDLNFFASDELAGRGAGSEGLQKAGDHIAHRFEELGFEVKAFDDSPFQNFTIPGPTVMGSREENVLSFQGKGLDAVTPVLLKDYSPLALGASGTFSGPVAFAGYGITASEYGYDDYASLDAVGKVVIVLRKEPQQNQADSKFEGKQNSAYAYFASKQVNASLHKVAALLLVNDRTTATASLEQHQQQTARADAVLAALKQQEIPSDTVQLERYQSQLRAAEQQILQLRSKTEQVGEQVLMGLNDAGKAVGTSQVPTFACTRALADRLLIAGGSPPLADLEAAIDRDGAPHSQLLEGITCTGQAKLQRSDTPVRNVIAVCPGHGALKDEYVVVGAHYDHVGMGGQGSLAPGTIAVHNGADDNGSGTATLLEVARQLAHVPEKDRRTLIFMAFSAEESGLLGSEHYVRNPRWPLENTVAMINLDMVGRLNKEELTVYGTGTAAEFASQIDRLNERYHFKVVKVPQGMGASDHASFYAVKIPVFHFFTGLHNDYHRPSDDVDKVNIPGMVRISQMVSDLTREIAEAPTRPSLVEIKGSANPRIQNGSRAALGVMLNSDANADARVVGLSDGGGAAAAGIKIDDVILKINSTNIASAGQVRGAISGLKTGDTVEVTVRRSGNAQVLTVKLGE